MNNFIKGIIEETVKEKKPELKKEQKILYYAVYKENTLGLLYKNSFDTYSFLVLKASGLKGSDYKDTTGSVYIGDEKDNIRKATKEDFEDYKVVLPPDFDEFNTETSENDIDEIVDEKGNIKKGSKPTNLNTKGVTSNITTDEFVKMSHGQLGDYGSTSTQNYRRYWGESDMSKALGYEETLGDDESIKKAYDHFTKELGLSHEETMNRLKQMGYDEELPKDMVRLVENPKKFMEEYIEDLLKRKNSTNDIISRESEQTEEKEINPIILKQIKSLKNSIESNNLTIDDVIKHLKNNE